MFNITFWVSIYCRAKSTQRKRNFLGPNYLWRRNYIWQLECNVRGFQVIDTWTLNSWTARRPFLLHILRALWNGNTSHWNELSQSPWAVTVDTKIGLQITTRSDRRALWKTRQLNSHWPSSTTFVIPMRGRTCKYELVLRCEAKVREFIKMCDSERGDEHHQLVQFLGLQELPMTDGNSF